MATVNFAQREITAKIIWFGEPESGLEVCLDRLRRVLRAGERSRMHTFGVPGSPWRSSYLDYSPQEEPIPGFTTRIRVYTLPTRVEHPVHRTEVIAGTDGIVYVADARTERASICMEGMFALERVLVEHDLRLAATPAALLIMHADAETARSEAQVTYDLNPYSFPVLMAGSEEDELLWQAQGKVAELTLARVRQSLAGDRGAAPITAVHRTRSLLAQDVVRRHQRAIDDSAFSMDSMDESDIPEGPVDAVVEVGCLPGDLVGSKPLRVLGSGVHSDRVQLDLLLQAPETTTPKRLRVVLASRVVTLDPSTTTPPVDDLPRPPPLNLPSSFELTSPPAPPRRGWEVSGLVFGVVGVLGGIISGVLLGFLLFH